MPGDDNSGRSFSSIRDLAARLPSEANRIAKELMKTIERMAESGQDPFLEFHFIFGKDNVRALEAIEEAVRRAREQGSLSRLREFRHWRIQCRTQTVGDLHEAEREAVDLVVDICENDPSHKTRPCAVIDLVQARLGMDPSRYLEECEAAGREAVASLPADAQCRVCLACTLVTAHYWAGDAAGAEEIAARPPIDLGGRAQDHLIAAQVEAMLKTGRHAEARPLVPAALAALGRLDEPVRAQSVRLELVVALARAGEISEAEGLLAEIAASPCERYGTLFQLSMRHARAELAWARGAVDEALELMSQVVAAYERLG